MKFTRVFALLITLVLLAALLPVVPVAAAEPAVVLRFLVASDVHLTEVQDDKQAQMLQGMFASAYAYADTQSYTAVDAVVLVGDTVCFGEAAEYDSLAASLDAANVREETEVLALMGNHEWWRYTNNAMTDLGSTSYLNALASIDEITEKGLNWSKAINGYQFIGMSPLYDDSYGDENCQWMADELAAATAADSSKPVFAFHHHPIKDTVMGSNGAGMPQAESDRLDATYNQYNQVILFTGHSHVPINAPTTINQTGYTQYNTGTMGTIGTDGTSTYNGILPNRDKVGQYTIVEVYEDNTVRMVPYDQYTDSRFASLNGDGSFIEYTVDVNDAENWLYKTATRPDNTGAPAFAADAAATATDATHESFLLSFPQATDDYGVYGYDILCDDGKEPLSYRIYSEYYFQPMPAALSYTVKGLSPETAYTVSVTPLDFFGNAGQPITCTVQTTAEPEEEIVYQPEAYTTNLVPYGDAESLDTTDWGLFKNAAFSQEQVHGGSYALKLTNSGSQAQVQVNLRGIVGGDTYRISAWVYVDATAKPTVQRALIAAVESPWSTLDAKYGTVSATAGQWTKYEFIYTAPAKTDLFQLSFYTADTDTYFYLDDLSVYRVCTHAYTTHTEATDAQEEYWACRTCGKCFADENCSVEIAPPAADDGKTYIGIDPTVDTDVMATFGYNSNDNRTYLIIQTAQTLPVADWGGYSGSTTVTFDDTEVTGCAAGVANANQLQIYVSNDTTDFTATATKITIPAGTAFTKGDTVVRFVKEFTVVKVNNVWKKAVAVADHSSIGPNLPNGYTNLLTFGSMDQQSGFTVTGNGRVKNGTLQMELSSTDDMASFTAAVEAGKTYRFSAYMYVTLAYNVSINGEENGVTGSYVTGIYGSANSLKADTDGWVEMTYEFTAAKTGTYTFYFVRNYWGGTATVFVDDLCLYDVNEVAAAFTAYNVTLSSDLKVGVQITPSAGVSLADLTLQYTLAGGVTQNAEYLDGLFYCHVPAKDMTSELSLTLLDADAQPITTATTTLRAYALKLLEGDQDDKVKTAAKAMLGYGAAAQTYFGYNTDAPADTDYAYTQAELDAADPGQASGVSADAGALPVTYVGASLLLQSKTGIRLYFSENVDGTLSYNTVNELYYYEFTGIGAAALATKQTVTLDGVTYTVSVLSMARQVMDSSKYGESFKDLMKAITLYYDAAVAL